ncbi:unnamed protein product [Orchesella dallaii]|uniref:Uncharacterized protein n=1 Tax=Orchesella dallaii TaxID=48710 RepID=A0ABP1QCN5_9HEXA
MLALVPAMETARVGRFIEVIVIKVVELTYYRLKVLKRISTLLETVTFSVIRKYRTLQVTHWKTIQFQEEILFCVYQCATFDIVFSLTGSIVGLKFLSRPAHIFATVIAAVILLFILVSITLALIASEYSESMLHTWQARIYMMKVKREKLIMERTLKSLRVIGFQVACLGRVNKKCKLRFWARVAGNTQDATLMVINL